MPDSEEEKVWAELTDAAWARFSTWLSQVARPGIDYDYDLMEYNLDGVFACFRAGLEGAIYTLDAGATRSGRPETFAFRREDVVVIRGDD